MLFWYLDNIPAAAKAIQDSKAAYDRNRDSLKDLVGAQCRKEAVEKRVCPE